MSSQSPSGLTVKTKPKRVSVNGAEPCQSTMFPRTTCAEHNAVEEEIAQELKGSCATLLNDWLAAPLTRRTILIPRVRQSHELSRQGLERSHRQLAERRPR